MMTMTHYTTDGKPVNMPVVMTPWGSAHSARDIGEGITFYTTASHGGYFVPPALFARMPEVLRKNLWAGEPWFEEDCDALKVVLAFPYYFREYLRFVAVRSAAKQWKDVAAWLVSYPEGKRLTAEAALYLHNHSSEFQFGCMGTSGRGWSVTAHQLNTFTRRLEFEIAEYPTWEEPFTMETARAHGAHNIREIKAA